MKLFYYPVLSSNKAPHKPSTLIFMSVYSTMDILKRVNSVSFLVLFFHYYVQRDPVGVIYKQ